jgi:hypothetical protein
VTATDPPELVPTAPGDQSHQRFSRRLERLIFLLGLAAAAIFAALGHQRAALGIAVGTVLAWLNYRWLDRGLGAIVSAALAQQGIPQPRVPMRVYYGFAGRYALIAAVVYATVKFLNVPVAAVFGGLLTLGAAAAAEGLYEVFTGSI